MYKYVVILVLVIYAASCSPKLTTTTATEDYVEDLSAYRPKVGNVGQEEHVDTQQINAADKGKYVPPTHDIKNEMSVIMDSIVVHNKSKLYQTFTIQVYTGRSREEANQIREKVYRVMPDEKPVLVYKQPSYKVNVGKYFDSAQAYKTLTTLRASFPEAMLVPERDYLEQAN